MNPAPSASSDIGPKVNPLQGALVLADEQDIDFVLEGPLALVWQRIYSSRNTRAGWLGTGWRTQLEVVLLAVPDRAGTGVVRWSCIDMFGRDLELPTLPAPGVHVASADNLTFRRSEQGRYSLETGDGLTYWFGDRAEGRCELQSLSDRNGNTIHLDHARMTDERAPMLRVRASGGQELALLFEQGRLRQIMQLREVQGQRVSQTLCRYEYDAHLNLGRVRNRADEGMRAFQYDARQLLCREAYAGTYEAWYEHEIAEGEPRVARHGDNVGQQWQLRYLPDETAVTDQDGRVWRFHVDGQRRWTGFTDPMGHHTRYGLNRQGKLRAIIDPLEHVTEMVYDERGNKVEVRDPTGGVTKIEWHPELGLPTAIVDPLGRATSFEYDGRGNLVAEIEADGATTRYELDARGLPVAITDAKGGVARLRYDDTGQVTAHIDCSGRMTRYEYDANGWLVAEIDAQENVTRYEYDAAGRLVRETAPDGSFEAYENDLAERPLRITNAVGAQTRMAYAPDGLLIERIDALGHRLRLAYTGSRQLSRIANENGATFAFQYDAADRLIGEVQFDGHRMAYAYDAAGRIVATVEAPDSPQAIVTRYRRDPLGRVLERSTPSTTTQMRYDAAGQLVEARNPQSHVRIAYDAAGQIVEEHLHTALGQQVIKHAYDELGNRLRTELPGAVGIQRLYYGSGHLHHLAVGKATVSDFERDALHREVSRTQGPLLSRRQYDAASRVQAFITTRPPVGADDAKDDGPVQFDRHVAYDQAGRPTAVSDGARVTNYAHDLLDRLIQEGPIHYRHDPAHNLLPPSEKLDPAGRLGNRLEDLGAVRYTYDVHGRVVEKRAAEGATVTRFVWDDEHRLIASVSHDQLGGVRETAYAYDPFGRRIAKTGGGRTTRYLWDGTQLADEDDGSRRRVYLYEQDVHEPLAMAELASGASPGPARLRHYHCDQAGIPCAMTDADGDIVWQARGLAWGRLAAETGAIDQPLRHQGQQFDDETGLHYNFQRYYDPDTGRFLSKDPIGLAGGLNEYQYVPSPLFWIDPTGLTGTYIMSGGKKRNYVGKGPKVRSQASQRARMKGCPKVAIKHKDYGDDEMGFMVEYLLMKHYNARKSANWANSSKLESPGKKKYAAASKSRKASARAKAKKLREEFEAEKTACGV